VKRRIINRILGTSIRTRLFILILIILIGSFTMMGYQQARHITTVIEKDALEKAQSDLATGLAIIDALYPGDWRAEGDQLYKGDTLINGNYKIVDYIGRLTNGDTATIFLGDTRVATNVILADGQRAVGTQASSVVAETVLKEGRHYLGTADVVGNSYQTAYMPIRDANGQVIGMWYVGAPDANERIRQLKGEMMQKLALGGLATLAIAFLLFYAVTRFMIRRIQLSARSIQTMAGGDLTLPEMTIISKDETGKLLESVNKMSKDLRGIIGHMKDTSTLIATSSDQLAAGTEQMNQAIRQINQAIQGVAAGADEQMNSVTDSTEAVLGISSGMDRVAEAIRLMARSSSAASGYANQGTSVVNRNMEQMDRVRQTFEDVSRMIVSLQERSREIDEIVVAITEIAEQTHLLALNASIEAAHAGEQGAGFAVVAAEVRKLADRSGESAENVSKLIRHIQEEASRAVQAVSQGSKVMEKGLYEAEQTGLTFQDIVSAIGEISARSEEVAAIVAQVQAHSHETANRMERMAELIRESVASTQHIATSLAEQQSSIEDISSAVGHLSETAETLQLLSERFKV
jgi:methyl-accepting chemotaxis protein